MLQGLAVTEATTSNRSVGLQKKKYIGQEIDFFWLDRSPASCVAVAVEFNHSDSCMRCDACIRGLKSCSAVCIWCKSKFGGVACKGHAAFRLMIDFLKR